MSEASEAVQIYAAQLAGKIIVLEMSLADEVAAGDRASVKAHYEKQIKAARWELSRVDPRNSLLVSQYDGIAPEPSPADVIRDEMYRLAGVRDNPENALHIRKVAAIGVARGFAELERLTGSPAPFSEQDVLEQFDAEAAARRAGAAQATPMSHMANREGAFRPRAPTQETQLVSDPVDRAIAARRRLHAEQAQQHQYSGRFHVGKSADEMMPIPTVSAAPYDLNGRGVATTARTNLSGRTAD